jgi:crotonobetainyl-CoA:carnitine CoA-transferase CaiB-like acyl-CoA transferase
VRPSPILGEDVNNVLASWLGMDARSIAALREEVIV